MSEEVTLTIEQRITVLEEGFVALSRDITNLISVLLHNEILFINKNEDGTVTYKLNHKDA